MSTIQGADERMFGTRLAAKSADRSRLRELVGYFELRHPPDTFLVSITRVKQRDEAVAFARMLRKSGFQGWIVLGWWKSKSLRQSTRRQLKEAGFDYVMHRMKSMDRILRFAVESTPRDEEPADHHDPFMVPVG